MPDWMVITAFVLLYLIAGHFVSVRILSVKVDTDKERRTRNRLSVGALLLWPLYLVGVVLLVAAPSTQRRKG